jgi:hypothetical protein
MLLAKKEPDTAANGPSYQKQLEFLYARRSTIDALIQSLEQYDRFRERRVNDRERQSA